MNKRKMREILEGNQTKKGRDKSKDDLYFNCSQEHEYDYVSGLYDEKKVVYDYLKEKCKDKSISYTTHMEVYKMIEKDLRYPVPIDN